MSKILLIALLALTISFSTVHADSVSVDIDDTSYEIEYTPFKAQIKSVSADMDFISLIFTVQVDDPTASLKVVFDRVFFDAKFQSGNDDDFFVLADGEEVNFDEKKTSTQRTLTFGLDQGTEELEIIGTHLTGVTFLQNTVSTPITEEAEKAAEAAQKAAEKAAAEKAAAEKAAALPMSISIENATGSSTPGCEPDCFIPNAATVAIGGTVTFVNSDTAPHTSTSGTPSDGPDGVWDSSLVMPGSSYDTTISSAGTYDYFCMVHPWMTGTITVK